MSFIISRIKSFFLLSLLLSLWGCERNQMAPVEELNPQYAMSHTENHYIVRNGDTLYAIAFLYDQNVRQLADLNHINYPYSIHIGQNLKLLSSRAKQHAYPQSFNIGTIRQHRSFMGNQTANAWQWPTYGYVAPKNFNNPIELKGITIIGHHNQSIVAAAKGSVAYAGNGLPGYGNLILIKHSNDYLSAYAFNSVLYVKEGQTVNAGQKIASMGLLDANKPGLHFEIRFRGQTINPLNILPRR